MPTSNENCEFQAPTQTHNTKESKHLTVAQLAFKLVFLLVNSVTYSACRTKIKGFQVFDAT